MNLSQKLSIKDLNLNNKRVLMRVDYNVPLDNKQNVTDPRRIISTIPSIEMALQKNAKSIVLMSHLGRPNGLAKKTLSLRHVLPTLQSAVDKICQTKIIFIPSLESEEYKIATENPADKSIYLLENLRFHIEEEGKGLSQDGSKVTATSDEIAIFRKKISQLGDIFVFDAFAASHRAHSSVVGVDLPIRAAGLLMDKELTSFSTILENPKKPFLSILGGAKVCDKIQLIESLLDKVDEMIIGGGMAYTFLKEMEGRQIGTSLYDEEGAKIVKKICAKADEKGVKLHLPVDFVLADKFSPTAKTKTCTKEEGIQGEWMGLDCGEKSRQLFSEAVSRAKTIVWNGPLGVFEFEAFQNGTRTVLEKVAEATAKGTVTIIGGGDTASAAEKFGLADKMTHVSTGGGASLELLEGKMLPGVANLSDNKNQ